MMNTFSGTGMEDQFGAQPSMKPVDQMFERAGATLDRTSYRWRCWLNTYHRDYFWMTAFRALPIFKELLPATKIKQLTVKTSLAAFKVIEA